MTPCLTAHAGLEHAHHNRAMKNLLLSVHVLAGTVSLISMFGPLVTKKGGRHHRSWGWVFVGAMSVVSVTALALALLRLESGMSVREQELIAVLAQASLLTAATVSTGVRVLRVKQRVGVHQHAWDLGLTGFLGLSSLILVAWGVAWSRPLLWGFALVGLFTAAGQWRYWRRAPDDPRHWWFQHMTAMLGACIAVITAFLVVNASRLGAGTFSVAIWTTPSLIGVPTILLWVRHYRRARLPVARRSD